MRYLSDEDCEEYCNYYPVCVKFGKLEREGCVLNGEGFPKGYPKDAQERDKRISRLREKLAEENERLLKLDCGEGIKKRHSLSVLDQKSKTNPGGELWKEKKYMGYHL